MRPRDLGFALPFTLALLPWAARAAAAAGWPADLAPWLTLIVIFGLLPLIDALLGIDTANPDDDTSAREDQRRYFRILTLLAVPVWFSVLAYCIVQLPELNAGALGVAGWLISTGVLGGTLAIVPAHELIHRNSLFERALGGLLLTSVGYFGFKVEHVRGHHVQVATPEDSSTAALGESVYAFVPRALACNVARAWQLEARRLRQAGAPVWSWRNELLCWTALWLALAGAITLWKGMAAVAFFIAQGLIAASTLEVINYIEHYGLLRSRKASGHYERVTHRHSWNASQRLSNWLLFNLQRHSDHHEQARRRYQTLRHHDDSPQLPAGYATMFVLALIPPLWRRIMDPRAARALSAGRAPIGA